MRVSILREQLESERRVAVTPETVKKLLGMGLEVAIESGAGLSSYHSDNDYAVAGATIYNSVPDVLKNSKLILTVQRPNTKVVDFIPSGTILIGLLDPIANEDDIAIYANKNITSFSLEFIPRISRAQSMDVLSSQSSLAGYRAVIDAVSEFDRALPLMMTAAGTIPPAKVFVLGAGVAGLQAIATAKRLGAVVFATDVRPAVAEQVESLGATFVSPPQMTDSETKGGYAKALDEEMKKLQAEIISDTLSKIDIAICTALIPGRKAPTLIDESMINNMKKGSVIIDLAVEQGGNCTLSKPGQIINANGIKIIGHKNMPSRIAIDSSALYARNLIHFLSPLIIDGELAIDWEDEIIQSSLLTHEGKIVNKQLTK